MSRVTDVEIEAHTAIEWDLSSGLSDLSPHRHTNQCRAIDGQVYLRHIGEGVECSNKSRRNLFIGGETCLQFKKNATPMELGKAKHNTLFRYACMYIDKKKKNIPRIAKRASLLGTVPQ